MVGWQPAWRLQRCLETEVSMCERKFLKNRFPFYFCLQPSPSAVAFHFTDAKNYYAEEKTKMLKISIELISEMESHHLGIKEQIFRFENQKLPNCPHCGSKDIANVQVGIIGRTIYIAGATTKFHLIPNGPKPGRCFCNSCRKFFE